jgi:hypothetical protein
MHEVPHRTPAALTGRTPPHQGRQTPTGLNNTDNPSKSCKFCNRPYQNCTRGAGASFADPIATNPYFAVVY